MRYTTVARGSFPAATQAVISQHHRQAGAGSETFNSSATGLAYEVRHGPLVNGDRKRRTASLQPDRSLAHGPALRFKIYRLGKIGEDGLQFLLREAEAAARCRERFGAVGRESIEVVFQCCRGRRAKTCRRAAAADRWR